MTRLTEQAYNNEAPLCILAAGETTVNVTGSGRGGRNQEMALAAGLELHSLKVEDIAPVSDHDVTFLSAGTDGQDGPTPAAGQTLIIFSHPILVFSKY